MQPDKTAVPNLRFDASSTGEFVRIVEAGFDRIGNEMCKFWFFTSIAPAGRQYLVLGNVELRAAAIQFVLVSAMGNPKWRNITPVRAEIPTRIISDRTTTAELDLSPPVYTPAPDGVSFVFVPKVSISYVFNKAPLTHQQFPDSVLIRTESSNSKVIWKLLFLHDADPEHSYQGNFGVEFHKSAQLVKFQYEIDSKSISVVKLRGHNFEPVIKPSFLNMLLTIYIQKEMKNNVTRIIFNKSALNKEMSSQECFS